MKYWFYHFVKFVLWVIFRVGFGFEVRGQEHVPKGGAFVLASNHTSYLDPPAIGAACPRRVSFMARTSLFRHPLLGAFMRGVHVIPLRRGEGDVGAIREAVHRLQQGEVVAIFPEGGRQLSGTLGAAKRGVGLLASTAGVPIVPVLVSGTFQALPPHARWFHRAKIRVAFGPAIPYTSAPLSAVAESDEDQRRAEANALRVHHERLAEVVTSAWHRILEEQRHDDRRRNRTDTR